MVDKKKIQLDFNNWILFNLLIPCLIPWGFLILAYLIEGGLSNHIFSSISLLFNKGFFTFIGLTLFFNINSDIKTWQYLPTGYTALIILCQIFTFYSFACSLDQSYDIQNKLNVFDVKWGFHLVVLIFTIIIAVFAKIALLKIKHTIYKENEIMTTKITH